MLFHGALINKQQKINQEVSSYFCPLDVVVVFSSHWLKEVTGSIPQNEGGALSSQATWSLRTNEETPFITIKNQIYFLRLQKKVLRQIKTTTAATSHDRPSRRAVIGRAAL